MREANPIYDRDTLSHLDIQDAIDSRLNAARSVLSALHQDQEGKA